MHLFILNIINIKAHDFYTSHVIISFSSYQNLRATSHSQSLPTPALNDDFRFKPVQKFDTCSGENYSSGGQSHPGAAEQTVIAQSQHHQQFLGQSVCMWVLSLNLLVSNFLPGQKQLIVSFLFPSPLKTDATRALPDFVDLDLGQSNTENISLDDVKALQTLYREHCEVRGSPAPLVHSAGLQQLSGENAIKRMSTVDELAVLVCSRSNRWINSLYCTVQNGNLLRRSGVYLLWKLWRERLCVIVATEICKCQLLAFWEVSLFIV